MGIGCASFASIVALCYLIGVIIKASKLNNKWIPTIVGCVGLVLGVVAFYTKVPDFPASDVITAAAIGAVSGLASTGAHQVGKQLSNSP